jgi:hypothetical protein
MGERSVAVRAYLDRVVNGRDLTGVDELVSPAYVGSGHGWPADLAALRAFYEWQQRERPDWHINVQDTVEVGSSVVVRAVAGGTVRVDGAEQQSRVEWLAHYRFDGDVIAEIHVLELVPRSP